MYRAARPAVGRRTSLNYADALVLVGITVAIYAGLRLALDAPAEVHGRAISLAPSALPRYALFSVGRMAVAYLLSLLFSLGYGYAAARSRAAERILLPILDVLQSIPILSFLPVVLLSLTAILPEVWAAEMASVALILTSQAWNMTFSVYQSLTTIPRELQEVAETFRLGRWLRFRRLELPSAAIGLVWNSMMSWAGGWFFLMAAETFAVGRRNFRLPGLGSYLYQAADQGNMRAILWGLAALVLTIVLLDQLLWRPILVWSDRFKLETVRGEDAPASWFYDLLERSALAGWLREHVVGPLGEWLDQPFGGQVASRTPAQPGGGRRVAGVGLLLGLGAVGVALFVGGVRAGQALLALPLPVWTQIGVAVLATTLRVMAALLIAVGWTLPVGVLIGTNRRLAVVLQPVVQMVASIPATALFPVVLLFLIGLPGGLNLAAILLMLMGTQWYALFNIIAGAASIPEDLRYTTSMLGLRSLERWRTLILPAIFPYLITGMITASGGAWNASIVAEYVAFGGQQYQTVGIGALIAEATSKGDYALLLGATVALVVTVVLINRFFWGRLYAYAAERCRME